MRELTSHKLTGLNDAIKILVIDEPGSGGANHIYALLLQGRRLDDANLKLKRADFIKNAAGTVLNAIDHYEDGSICIIDLDGNEIAYGLPGSVVIKFQNGPIQEAGFNGLTGEALLAVQIDRMNGFQYGRKPDGSFDEAIRGKFASRDNAISLTHTEDALSRLQKRTRDRLARGVEGTHKV